MSNTVIGNTAVVTFLQFRNVEIEGKVDTGATTSSLHAENISVNGSRVSFMCPALSENTIILDLRGTQEVHSADAGGVVRPIVNLDIAINGKVIHDVEFNLNDRSGMDSDILIGQNILQPNDFIIDPNKQPPSDVAEAANQPMSARYIAELVITNNVSFNELVEEMITIRRERLAHDE